MGLKEVAAGALEVAEAHVAQAHQVEAVYAVLLVHVVLPDLQVGQGDGEVVHVEDVVEVLLAEVDEAVEAAARLGLAASLRSERPW